LGGEEGNGTMMRVKVTAIAAALFLAATLAATGAEATTVWTARPYSSVATIRLGTPDRLSVTSSRLRPATRYTIALRRGGCFTLGTLVASTTAVATNTGTLNRTISLTTAQTRVAHLPLSIRIGSRCGAFVQPMAVTPPVPTPTPAPIAGATRANPVPLGQSARVGDWTLTVTGISADAWPAIQSANMYNDPPTAGQQFFMIAVAATYLGSGSDHLDSGLTMHAVGSLNVGYTTFSNSCGVLPEPNLYMTDPEVFTGGMVSGNAACWAISASDASSLVMYFQPFLSGATVWFALH
jgi:hypothetical protein